MSDIQTVDGSVLLNTNPTQPALPLYLSRNDAALGSNPLAAIGLFGAGTSNLQGVITFRTMNSGTPSGALVERMRVHTNGAIGIGTPAPAENTALNVVGGAIAVGPSPQRADAALHVTGAFGGFDRLSQMSPGANGKPGLNLTASKSAAGQEQWWAWGVTTDNSWNIRSGTTLGGGFTIAPAGHVSVGGDLGLSGRLNVAGDVALAGKHALRSNDIWLRLNQDGAFFGVHTPGVFAPGSLNVGGARGWANPGNGNAWVTGNVGIGTDTPRRRLHVHGDSEPPETYSEIHTSGKTAGFSFTDREAGRTWDNGQPGERWVLYSAGKVARLWTSGVGDRLSVDTGGSLTVQGDIRARNWVTITGAGNEQAYIGGDGAGADVQIGSNNPNIANVGFWNTATGKFMVARAADFIKSSDARLKTNVEPLTGALERVSRLQGVRFDWTQDGTDTASGPGRQIGLIAQDVAAAVPEVVSTDKQGMYGVSYGSLVAVLVEAIKEQQQRLEALEQRCAALATRAAAA